MTLAGMNESGIVEFRPLNDIGVCQNWFGCGEHHLVQAFVEACDRYNDADKKCQAESISKDTGCFYCQNRSFY